MSNAEPKSPLTIIAIFAGIIEASALASLPFLGEDSQNIYTWFLVGFPPFLTLLFFLTLNFNTKTLYGPEANEVDPDSELELPENYPQSHLALERPTAPHKINTDVPPRRQLHCEEGDYPVSTITLRGTQARSMVLYLIKRTLSQQAKPGRLILQDLDTGSQTTIITRPLATDPDHA